MKMRELIEATDSSFVKKVRGMTDDQRSKLGPLKRGQFTEDQMKPYLDKIAKKVSVMINADAKKMKIDRIDMMSGKIVPNQYNAQGMLEKLIRILEEMV